MASWLSLRPILAALLVGSAGLFAVGVAIERSQPQHAAAREAAERAEAGTPAATGGESRAGQGGGDGTATTAPTPAGRAGKAGESTAERASEDGNATTPKTTEHAATTTVGGERPAERAGEGGAAAASRTKATPSVPLVTEVHSERVFGLNPDAAGLVAAAIAASLLLALGVWRFPALRPLLVLVALAALAFCAFDVREAVHQASESRTGLVVIAAVVAALHLAAAAVALTMARRTTAVTGRPRTEIG